MRGNKALNVDLKLEAEINFLVLELQLLLNNELLLI